MWVELGFKVLKRVGWQWQRTRRTDLARVARYWLILAVATFWVLAYGTRVEDAGRLGVAPAQLRTPPAPLVNPYPRRFSVFQQRLRFCNGCSTWGAGGSADGWLPNPGRSHQR